MTKMGCLGLKETTKGTEEEGWADCREQSINVIRGRKRSRCERKRTEEVDGRNDWKSACCLLDVIKCCHYATKAKMQYCLVAFIFMH